MNENENENGLKKGWAAATLCSYLAESCGKELFAAW